MLEGQHSISPGPGSGMGGSLSASDGSHTVTHYDIEAICAGRVSHYDIAAICAGLAMDDDDTLSNNNGHDPTKGQDDDPPDLTLVPEDVLNYLTLRRLFYITQVRSKRGRKGSDLWECRGLFICSHG